MTQSWTEIRRQTQRRRRFQVLALVIGFLACAGAWAYASRTPSSSTEVAATGEVDGSRTLDTSPFSSARPDTRGPTTIPESMFPGDPGVDATSATKPPDFAPTTTAPAPPSGPEVLSVSAITSICGMSRSVGSFGLFRDQPASDILAEIDEIQQSLRRYAEIAPAEIRQPAESAQRLINGLANEVRAAQGDMSAGQLPALIEGARSGTGPYGGVVDAMAQIATWEESNCKR